MLAAGGGTRFDGPTHKLLADLRGRPLVAHAIANLVAAGFPVTAVVTGAVDLSGVVPTTVTVLVNERWADGQATSLAVAVRWATELGIGAVVVGLGDQPGVLPSAWAAVASAGRTPIAVATYRGRRGHPVRLEQQVWDRLPVSGDAGARTVMAESPELVTEVPCDGNAMDVDTVEDLTRWQ